MNVLSLAKKIKKRVWFKYRIACINAFIRLSIGYIILHISKRNLLKKKIWIVMERATEARDNGFSFFCYMKEKHPDIDTYYIIIKGSPDEKKLKQYKDNIIHYNTYKHIYYYLAAECSISTHERGVTSPYCFHGYTGYSCIESLSWFVPTKQIIVFLQHGITKEYLNLIDMEKQPKRLRPHLFIAAASRERDFIESVGHWPKHTVVCTGFSRFDLLFRSKKEYKHQILIMPTWRKWLAAKNTANIANATEKNKFINSSYFKAFQQLLNNNKIVNLLNIYNYQLIFYPHYELQSYINTFSCNSSRITIANRNIFDIQKLLIESSILITDYSSVYFDFAYMKKPELFYQFDKEKFRQKQYKECTIEYKHKEFGRIAKKEDEVIEELEKILKNGCKMEEKYIEMVEDTFAYIDNNNCKRTYDEIIKLLNY